MATFAPLCCPVVDDRVVDGRVSLALFKGRLLLYARANTNPRGGGRPNDGDVEGLMAAGGAAKGCENPNFKGSYFGRFPLVSADFSTCDHLSERS